MPRSLLSQILAIGFVAKDVRDIGLRGCPDSEVVKVATADDAIIITRDRGFADPRGWPKDFTAGTIFVNFPSDTSADIVNEKVLSLLTTRIPSSLLGCFTTLEPRRALSRLIYRR